MAPRFRPLAIIPFILSLGAFLLTLIPLTAGVSKGTLEDYAIIHLNVSNAGQNLVIITPANTTNPTSTGLSPTRRTAAPTAPPNAAPSPTTIPASNITNPLAGLLPTVNPFAGALGPFETGLMSGLTADFDRGLADAINNMVTTTIKNFGLHQFYSFYVRSTCEGDFTPNATAINAGRNTTLCELTSKLVNLPPVPNYVIVAGTNVTIPALKIAADLSANLEKQLKTQAVQLFTVYIFSAVSSGVVVLFSFLLFFVPSLPLPHTTGQKVIFYPANIFSQLAQTFQITASIAVTIVSSNTIDQVKITRPIGIVITRGNKFLVVTWVAAALAGLSAIYYGWVYWSEFRTWRITGRRLGDGRAGEIGKGKGVERGVMRKVQMGKR